MPSQQRNQGRGGQNGRVSAESLDASDTEPEAKRPRGRTSRRRLAVGLLLLALVLVGLGWTLYQYVGTDLVARQAYREETAALRQAWRDGSGDPPGEGEPLALLRIPSFGPSYEVPILAGTDLDTLQRGVGHYSDTVQPGQVGNFAVAGHCATHGHPFGRLLDLKRGDEVVVETRTAIYAYVIDVPPSELTVSESAGWVLDPVPGEPGSSPTRELLTLTTCQDLLRSPDRAVGFGHLQSTINKE
jgi:sortase A